MLKNPKRLKYISPLKIPEGKSGEYEITHILHPAGMPVTAISTRTAIYTGQRPLKIRYEKPILYTVLKNKNGVLMTDIPQEQITQHHALIKCKGQVLVGGLGLGYFVKKLQEKDNVTKVITVEISQDVINLVWKHLKLDKRFSLVHSDIKKYLKEYRNHKKYDWVYLDVWGADSEGAFIDTVLPLKRLAYKYMCSNIKHILSWQEDVMLGQIQQGLICNTMFCFDKIMSISTKEFNKLFRPNNRYLAIKRIFWKAVRENQMDAQEAMKAVPEYMKWIRNGMQNKWTGRIQ